MQINGLDVADIGDINDNAISSNTSDGWEQREFTAKYCVGNRHPDYSTLNFTSIFPVHLHAAIVIKHNNCDNQMEQISLRNQMLKAVYKIRPSSNLTGGQELFTIYSNSLFSSKEAQLESLLSNQGSASIITYYTASPAGGSQGWHDQYHTTGEESYGGCNPSGGEDDFGPGG